MKKIISSYSRTVVGCISCIALTFFSQSGFIVVFYFLYLIPAFFYYVFLIYKYPNNWRFSVIVICAWALSMLIALAHISYLSSKSLKIGNIVASGILDAKNKSGKFPEDLTGTTLDNDTISQAKMIGVSYINRNGHPYLFRTSPNVPFVTSSYNFQEMAWSEFND